MVQISLKNSSSENQDGGVGRHTAPPRTTRTDRKSNGKEVRHQGDKMKAVLRETKENVQGTNSEGKETRTQNNSGPEGRKKHSTSTE